MTPKPLLLLLLFLATPAQASTVAFEDHGVLPRGGWQLNTIMGFYPLTQRFVGGTLSPSPESSQLNQLNQEFRFGLTDHLMIRTTLPLSFLREPSQTLGGLGDWECFFKLLLNDDQQPFQAALGFQVLLPTAFPSIFSANGAINLIPSLMLKQDLGGGSLNLTTGYQQAIGLGNSTFCGLGYNRDLNEKLNVVAEGLLVQDQSTRLLTCGPGLTWSFAEGRSLLASLQLPVLRQGDFQATGPYSGILQFSQEF